MRAAQLGTSLLAGSTRWMAPELILSLVEDDGATFPVTRESDVFSFACVCLEVRIPFVVAFYFLLFPFLFLLRLTLTVGRRRR